MALADAFGGSIADKFVANNGTTAHDASPVMPSHDRRLKMSIQPRLLACVAAIASLLIVSSVLAGSNEPKNAPQTKADALVFGGIQYLHRWSKDGQNEFTPKSDGDLAHWRDMVTINVHETVRNGDQLADLANRVLDNYQSHGKIVRSNSRPRTAQRPAEHLIVALLGNQALLETAFARIVLVDGVGVVAVYSHRAYGNAAAETTGEWLNANGQSLETTLMSWDKIPSPASLKQLRQSK